MWVLRCLFIKLGNWNADWNEMKRGGPRETTATYYVCLLPSPALLLMFTCWQVPIKLPKLIKYVGNKLLFITYKYIILSQNILQVAVNSTNHSLAALPSLIKLNLNFLPGCYTIIDFVNLAIGAIQRNCKTGQSHMSNYYVTLIAIVVCCSCARRIVSGISFGRLQLFGYWRTY